ncbi:hypothetical protein BDN70DRAFT_877945 [Pholiota conissans]|uniref:Uncharacterized protein n=1 Tax=Pholiota conissans TaxID=109636 RepID=A0A9P5Z3K8_9AGAR|nr:hypothetical protein BDN70DRAFT_877945 [Pholiota conissans]
MSGEITSSRPMTPLSPLTNNLHNATSTIDDLTAALANFSRVPSPDPLETLTCCCGKDDCENLKAWLELKSRLASRLVLSAEVGQALLQRHAAYVRQTERNQSGPFSEEQNTLQLSNDDLHHELEELLKEKAQLEKRLNQVLVNNEVTEVSNKTILNELQEARETISRLTAHHARSIGWDTRLSAAMKERDDMQQERDGETHRARLAESRFAALKEKTAKLQTEVRRLQDSLETKRHSRLELSESILQEARSRLDSVRNSQVGVSAQVEQDELTRVLESLVQDNEILKHDNNELQHLLSESREDLHAIQEELEEQRANQLLPRSGANTPNSRHFHNSSVTSISLKDYSGINSNGRRRNASAEGKNRRRYITPQQIDVPSSTQYAPPTPDGARSPLSDQESLAPPWIPFGRRSSRSSHISFDVDEDAEDNRSSSEFERQKGPRPLLLLSRSRGVQTDSSGALSPSPFPSHMSSISPQDPRSESSSFSESNSSHISAILERAAGLLNRLTQADALTLTNRLKRQHLKGADVGHLSRSTVANIIAEATSLRGSFRGLLEDEKMVTICTRKDLRVLFKFFKDVFTEMGQLRVTVNDIVLDPSLAPRISDLALNPGKAEAERIEKEREGNVQGGVAAWMAPISKLFSPTGRVESSPGERSALSRGGSLGQNRDTSRPARFVPKLGPALAASATTVNVEFSGTGVGRAVTSTLPSQPITAADFSTEINVLASGQSMSSGLMGIFAGAPRTEVDPWVVVPTEPAPSQQTLRRSTSFFMKQPDMATATIGRSMGHKSMNRLSRNVDAVIDVDRPPAIDEESDTVPPLLERTLRRRGLSDSSIHSTFTSQGDEGRTPTLPPSPQRTEFSPSAGSSSRIPAWSDRASVFQALTRTVQNLRASALSTPTSALSRETPSKERSRSPTLQAGIVTPSVLNTVKETVESSQPSTPTKKVAQPAAPTRIMSPNRGRILPNLTPWATGESVAGDDPFIASSLRDESYIHRRDLSRSRVGNEETRAREY